MVSEGARLLLGWCFCAHLFCDSCVCSAGAWPQSLWCHALVIALATWCGRSPKACCRNQSSVSASHFLLSLFIRSAWSALISTTLCQWVRHWNLWNWAIVVT